MKIFALIVFVFVLAFNPAAPGLAAPEPRRDAMSPLETFPVRFAQLGARSLRAAPWPRSNPDARAQLLWIASPPKDGRLAMTQPWGETLSGKVLSAEQEQRAIDLGAEIRCVVCQAESINDSSADMAKDLRRIIREKISAGESDDQIRYWLRERYGDFILLRPPLQKNTLLLWLAPLLAAAIVAMSLLLAMGKGRKYSRFQ